MSDVTTCENCGKVAEVDANTGDCRECFVLLSAGAGLDEREALRAALVTALSVALHEEADPECSGVPDWDVTAGAAGRVADAVMQMPIVRAIFVGAEPSK